MGAELLPLTPGWLELVSGDDFDLQKVAAALTEPLPPTEEEADRAIPFPELPKDVELTAAVQEALKRLPLEFGAIRMDHRRMLSIQELGALTTEADTIEQTLSVLGKRKEIIKEIIRHHIDVSAEQAGEAVPKRVKAHGRILREATPRDKHGHYLLAIAKKPFEVPVAGWAKGWQQRFTSGKTSQSLPMLEQLLAEGKVTRQEYLDFTRAVRVLDPDNVRKAIRKSPGRALQILAAITKREEPGSSLYPAEK